MLNRDEKLVRIASDNNETYENRKQALDEIQDKYLINHLAETANDDWIQLESAIICKNRRILKELLNCQDERIQLEAAIELNNQKCLANIVLNSRDTLHRDIALNYITHKTILRDIVKHCNMEKEIVEIALRLKDNGITKKTIPKIKDEGLKLRMAESINDIQILTELSLTAEDKRIRQLAQDWVNGLRSESDID